MTTNKNNDGCCGYDSVAAQFADRQSFIEAANSATTIAELEEMASDVPYRWHNVSALPAAIAVQTRANALAGVQDKRFGFTVDDYGYLRRITGYDRCGCPIFSDHTHRDEQGNPQPCDKTKAECDAWHQAEYERNEAFAEELW